MTAKDKQSLR